MILINRYFAFELHFQVSVITDFVDCDNVCKSANLSFENAYQEVGHGLKRLRECDRMLAKLPGTAIPISKSDRNSTRKMFLNMEKFLRDCINFNNGDFDFSDQDDEHYSSW